MAHSKQHLCKLIPGTARREGMLLPVDLTFPEHSAIPAPGLSKTRATLTGPCPALAGMKPTESAPQDLALWLFS